MVRSPLRRTLAALAVVCGTLTGNAQDRGLQSPRLYVLDGGVLASEAARYRLEASEVEEVSLANLYATVRYSGHVARIKLQTGSVEYIDVAPPATNGYAVHGIAVRPSGT